MVWQFVLLPEKVRNSSSFGEGQQLLYWGKADKSLNEMDKMHVAFTILFLQPKVPSQVSLLLFNASVRCDIEPNCSDESSPLPDMLRNQYSCVPLDRQTASVSIRWRFEAPEVDASMSTQIVWD